VTFVLFVCLFFTLFSKFFCIQVSQSEGAKNSTKEAALTRMLITLSIVFMVCIISTITVRVVPMLDTNFQLGGRKQNIFMLALDAQQLFTAINSSLNFFFYFKMGTKFRATFFSLCCRGRGGRGGCGGKRGGGGGEGGVMKGTGIQTMILEMSESVSQVSDGKEFPDDDNIVR
jgi:uncharacterized membrane protein YgcG